MKVILDFCGHCGVLIIQSYEPDIKCDNCGGPIDLRDDRIQGEFEEAEANKLKAL